MSSGKCKLKLDTPIRIAEIQNTDNTKWQRCEVKELSSIANGTATWAECLEVSY